MPPYYININNKVNKLQIKQHLNRSKARNTNYIEKAPSSTKLWIPDKIKTQRQVSLAGGLHRSLNVFGTVVCVFAPTFQAPGDRIKSFYEDLQDVLNGIPVRVYCCY